MNNNIIRVDLSSVLIEKEEAPKISLKNKGSKIKLSNNRNVEKEKDEKEKDVNKYGLKKAYHSETSSIIEIGIDEAGRGPLFGRLYVAAVVLPKDKIFDIQEMRDSKKITSKKKITELSEYIKQNSEAWYIHYIEAEEIDSINIRQAVLKAMRECIRMISLKIKEKIKDPNIFLLIDGNDFPPYIEFNENTNEMKTIDHETITGGDNLYVSIACASILAKVERDKYITNLCNEFPKLKEKYKLEKNMGYGTKEHIEGIQTYGISEWHRKTYGCCKKSPLNKINELGLYI